MTTRAYRATVSRYGYSIEPIRVDAPETALRFGLHPTRADAIEFVRLLLTARLKHTTDRGEKEKLAALLARTRITVTGKER
jgi:hypothetical protein